MLYEKPNKPDANDYHRKMYAPIVEAVRAAQEAQTAPLIGPVTTREVYLKLSYEEGGGRNPSTWGESSRVQRLVRRLKNAATLDLIDGWRQGVGFVWSVKP